MRKRGSYAKGVAKRDEILTAALDVIAREGYRGTSVKELAQAVGLSQPGLLYYFDSKDELFVEILRKRDELDLKTYWREGAENPFRTLLSVMRHNAKVPGLVELYARLSAEASDKAHPAHRYFVERRETLFSLLGTVIEEGKKTGQYPADVDPVQVGIILNAAADGLQIMWLQDSTIDMAGELEKLLFSLNLLAPQTMDAP